jgi:hypothetical protein
MTIVVWNCHINVKVNLPNYDAVYHGHIEQTTKRLNACETFKY